MLSRRRFLGYSIAGVVGASVGCKPPDYEQLANQHFSTTAGKHFLHSKRNLAVIKKYFLGYPLNMNNPPRDFFEWRANLKKVGLGDFGYNNVGNPFKKSSIAQNSHELEKETILSFGKQYGFSSSDIWGFISHSGTDSNMHGMYIGRSVLEHKTGIIPRCYFTKEAHYSIQILCNLLGMKPEYVKTLQDASMDIDDLQQKMNEHANQPALIVASIGTTFKGAIDDVDGIRALTDKKNCYLHLDAALFGGYLPHTSGAGYVMHRTGGSPLSRYESIAVSCHKFFGFPSPAGLFITTRQIYETFQEYYGKVHNPEYIGHVPGTITCSRDAVKPAEFFYFSSPASLKDQSTDARNILKLKTYLYDEMMSRLPEIQATCVNELSNTIFFRIPRKDIVKKYSLASMQVDTDGALQDFAHVVIMPHVTKQVLDEFLSELEDDFRIRLG